MYIGDGVTISKASDGTFLISCRVKKKMKKEKEMRGEKSPQPMYPETEEKTLTASSEE